MKKKKANNDQPSQILFYQTEDGQTRLDVQLQKDTVWLSLNQMATLIQRDKSVISKHIKNVFEEGELSPDSTIAKFATTGPDGKTYQVDHYNLDMIISVGVRESFLAKHPPSQRRNDNVIGTPGKRADN